MPNQMTDDSILFIFQFICREYMTPKKINDPYNMNNMKSTFLFLLTTTMMTCTAYGQSSNHKENKLPDWAFGGFERPKNVNPVISPIEKH